MSQLLLYQQYKLIKVYGEVKECSSVIKIVRWSMRLSMIRYSFDDVQTFCIYSSRAFITVPKLMKLLFYSEILDQHYAVCVTRRTVAKIEEATSFDHYILKVSILRKGEFSFFS